MEASIPESRHSGALESSAWIHLRPQGAIPSRSGVFFQFRSQQSHRGCACNMHDVQNLSNHLKLERTVTLKKSSPMSTQSEDLFGNGRVIHRAVLPSHSGESNRLHSPEPRYFPEDRAEPAALTPAASLHPTPSACAE